ncbi:methyltransferase domain-containing protein [Ditylenchus destructor]|nr:methyltransferase domain-containing protein [Ditylenchus destructor]
MAEQSAADQLGPEESTQAFKKRLFGIASNGLLSLNVGLGSELGLYQILADCASKEKPASVEKIAKIGELKPRYVKEWLSCMVCAQIVETDPRGEHFWITEEKLKILLGNTDTCHKPDDSLVVHGFLPNFAKAFDDVAGIFRKDGPYGLDYESYIGFFKPMNEWSRSLHRSHHLTKEYVEAIGVKEALERGIDVLDVGSGEGHHVMEIAKYYPASRFTSLDIYAPVVETSSARAKQLGINNIDFIVGDAQKMAADWSKRFDLITVFDSCHDQHRPDITFKEMHRCLKVGGRLAVCEYMGSTGNCYEDRKKFGNDLATLFYAGSVMHCLPIGSNSADSLRLGTMSGTEVWKHLLALGGFEGEDVSVIRLPCFPVSVFYRALKSSE